MFVSGRRMSRKSRRNSKQQLATAAITESLESRVMLALVGGAGEGIVNTFTTDLQTQPAIAMNKNGDYVVVWTSGGQLDLNGQFTNGQDGLGSGIYAQRFNAAGVAQGAEFLVNSYTFGNQLTPAVAMDDAGDFVIVWASYGEDTTGYGVFGQRYNAAGVAQGLEFQVDSFTLGDEYQPAVAMNGNGDFVVSWTSPQGEADSGIQAARFNAAGIPVGAQIHVNTVGTGVQQNSSVGIDDAGDFVVAWESYFADGSSWAVSARRFDSTGAAQGSEFLVNSFTAGAQQSPAVAVAAAGNFTIAWQSDAQDGSGLGIYARRYSSAGIAAATEFLVNTFTTGNQSSPAISISPSGTSVISWDSFGQDGNLDGIFAQSFDSAGVAVGNEFRVNSSGTPGQQTLPASAMNKFGDAVIVYATDSGSGGLDFDVFARSFTEDNPPATVGVVASTPASSEAGQVPGVFTISRGAQTTGSLIVNFSWAGTATQGTNADFFFTDGNGNVITVNGSTKTGTITIPNGQSSVQLRVVPNDDAFDESDETVIVTLKAGAGYILPIDSTLTGTVTIADDDTQGLVVTPLSLFVLEGSNDTFTVQLGARPLSDVVVTLFKSGDTNVTVDKSTLTFTSFNYNIAQTVTVSDSQDPDALNGTATVTISASGLTSQIVNVSEIDDELPRTATPGAPDLDPGSDSGSSSTDNITSRDNSTTLKKLTFVVPDTIAGATVNVYSDGVLIGTAVASGTSTTVITNGTTDIADGTHKITAKQQTPGTQFSVASASINLTVDTIAPVVTISQGTGQHDPTNLTPIQFAVLVSENVADLSEADFSIGGTANPQTLLLNGSGKTYTANVSGLFTTAGTVVLDSSALVVHDAAGNTSGTPVVFDGSVDYTPGVLPPAGAPFAQLSLGKLTVNGTNNNDIITLSSVGSDVVAIVNGNAFRFASSGVTSIEVYANDGNDQVTIFTGVMSTYVLGGYGNDTLIGGDGNDSLTGAAGKDSLVGGAGDDKLTGGKHQNIMDGGDGNDRIYGGDAPDSILGGNGRDRVYGGDGNDTILGGNLSDTLYGEGGNDFIDGQNHNDRIFPGDGKDTVRGGQGDDNFFTVDGSIDVIDGGTGNNGAQHDLIDLLTNIQFDL